jgi:site-specific recombinase XerC
LANWTGTEYNKKENNYQAKNIRLRKILNEVELLLLSDDAFRLTDREIRDRVILLCTGKRREPYFVDWIKECCAELDKPGTRTRYMSVHTHIMEYDKTATFSTISQKWIRGFDLFMRDKGIANNSRAGYLTICGTLCNKAIQAERTDRNPFSSYKRPKHEQTRKRSVGMDRLAEIASKEFTDKKQERARDIFMLTFYLIGINMADLFGAKWEDIKDDRLEYRRAKTGRLYSVLIPAEAYRIIEKYKGREHVLYFAEEKNSANNTTNTINYMLKRAFGDDLTMYWARHTWASVASDLDISKETISAALGHEIGCTTTSIYIDYNIKKVDEANRLVIDALSRAILARQSKDKA